MHYCHVICLSITDSFYLVVQWNGRRHRAHPIRLDEKRYSQEQQAHSLFPLIYFSRRLKMVTVGRAIFRIVTPQ